MKSQTDTNPSQDRMRVLFKRWPKLYYFVVYIFGPAYMGYMTPKDFLDTYFQEVGVKNRTIINLGSGPKVIRDDLINVDMTPYKEVNIIADLMQLPFEDQKVDGLICETALEHVVDPARAVSEMNRVLKPGGIGYVTAPFLYPFHASPDDYTRWTERGLRNLFSDFEILEIGTRSGLFSVLNVWLCYVIPSFFSFGNDMVYWFLVNISLVIFFPIKFLDVITNRLPFANRTASVLFCVIKKTS